MTLSHAQTRFTPSTAPNRLARRLVLATDQWGEIPISSGWTAANAGSGATLQGPRVSRVDTGTTDDSTSLLRFSAGTGGWSAGQLHTVVDWSKPMAIQLTMRAASVANGVARFTFGKNTSTGVAALATKGFGFSLANLAISGLAHNGTSLTTTSLSTTLTIAQTYRIVITSDGAGNMEYFIDGVSKGTNTGGPTTAGTAADCVFQSEVDNTATDNSLTVTLQLMQLKFYIAQ